MNRCVCQKCRRYGGSTGNAGAWWCGKTLYEERCDLVPGHSRVRAADFHPMTSSRKEPPEWCERPLEQVITAADEEVSIQKDKLLVYDGNREAEWAAENARTRCITRWARLSSPWPV